MKPDLFLKNYLLEKISKNQFNKIIKKDLLSNGILDSLDIVILATKIKKTYNIDIKINSQKIINIFRSYKELLKFIKKNLKNEK
jgi:acyl carrier protein